MSRDLTITRFDSIPYSREHRASIHPQRATAAGKSCSAAVPASYALDRHDRVVGCRCRCLGVISLGHRSFGCSCDCGDAVERQLRQAHRGGRDRGIHPPFALWPLLCQEADHVVARLDATFRDITAHGMTSTASSWAYGRLAALFEHRLLGVVFAREMSSLVEHLSRHVHTPCRRVGLWVR
jgi:hypothetical protein